MGVYSDACTPGGGNRMLVENDIVQPGSVKAVSEYQPADTSTHNDDLKRSVRGRHVAVYSGPVHLSSMLLVGAEPQ